MMIDVAEALGAWAPMVVEAGARGVALLAVVALTMPALRRASAATRHAVWSMALTALLALPFVGVVTPSLEVVPAPWKGDAVSASAAVPATTSRERDRAAAVASPDGRVVSDVSGASSEVAAIGTGGADPGGLASGPGDRPSRTDGSPAAATTAPGALDGGSLLVLLWLAGSALLLAPAMAARLLMVWIGLRSRPFDDPRIRSAADRTADRLGLRGGVRLLEGPPGSMPMTWGVLAPTVMLPADAAAWPAARLETVLLHEMGHVARRDCLTQLVGETARAVHWFNPLAWWGERRLRMEREHACDDLTLAHGSGPAEYAAELLELARSHRVRGTTSLAALAMARPSRLEGRLLAVLDEGRRRGAPGRGRTVATAAAIGALTLGLAAAAPAAPAARAEQPAQPAPGSTDVGPGSTDAGPATDSEPIPTDPEVQEVAPAARVDLAATCLDDGRGWQQSQHQRNDHRTSVTMRRPGCEIDVLLEGEVEFDAVRPAIRHMESGSMLRIEETSGGVTRWLEVEPGPVGELAFEYRLDGRSAPFDESARRWYRDVVLALFRTVGFAAEERVEALLREGGVDAVLSEMDHLTSDYVQARYFGALVERAELEEDEYLTVLRLARTRIDSDHYMAEILGGVLEHQSLTPVLLDEYFEAALTLDSDHYLARVLDEAIGSGRLSEAQVEQALEVAARMDSDHYRAEILGSIADRYALQPSFRPAYLRAIEGMDSDHYRTTILTKLLARDDLSSAELADVIAASTMIDSDHYRSEILAELVPLGLDDPTLHRAFFEAAAGLDSDHYYGRTMGHLVARDGVDPDLVLEVVDHAIRHLDSDHRLTELMLDILEVHGRRGDVRDALQGALDSIDSGHYRGRLAEALLRAERGG